MNIPQRVTFQLLIDINDEVLVTDDTTLMESGWSYFDKRMLKMQVTYKSDEECVEHGVTNENTYIKHLTPQL